tara:strand:- start:27822 stop:28214 length:393 start_codon:yes stop_codon:yes gene_type:complete
MDKLRVAVKLITKEAKRRREDGEIPLFLGDQGMLALMYDSIIGFSKVGDDEVARGKYLQDLAVRGIFAFMTVLPDLDDLDADDLIPDDDIEDTPQQEQEEEDETPTEEEEDANDPRWTKVKPGDALPGTA